MSIRSRWCAGRPARPDKTPLVADTLRGITASTPGSRGCGAARARRAGGRALVDAVIVALLFCGDLRRTEASALVWADIEPTERPEQLRGRVRTSKANPDHRARRPSGSSWGPFARRA